jgi:hypothetical protein
MKKLTLLTVALVSLLFSCTKEEITNQSNTDLNQYGYIEVDGERYNAWKHKESYGLWINDNIDKEEITMFSISSDTINNKHCGFIVKQYSSSGELPFISGNNLSGLYRNYANIYDYKRTPSTIIIKKNGKPAFDPNKRIYIEVYCRIYYLYSKDTILYKPKNLKIVANVKCY